MAVAEIYREVVLAHNRAPQRFGALPDATHAGDGDNPACGDALHVVLRVADGRIVDLRFSGEACAVTIAAASMLGELLVDGCVETLACLREDFGRLLGGEPANPALGELAALAELARHPARHRCALLAFEAVASALSNPTFDADGSATRAGVDASGTVR